MLNPLTLSLEFIMAITIIVRRMNEQYGPGKYVILRCLSLGPPGYDRRVYFRAARSWSELFI